MSETLIKAIRKIVKPGGFNVAMDRAVVLSVDKNAYTCSVQLVADEAQLDDVKLKPVINDGNSSEMGLVLFPAIQSFVTIGQLDEDNTDLVVIDITQIESISLDTATALSLLISADGKLDLNAVLMTFNKGKNGGIPLLNPLTSVILNLQQQLNILSNAFKVHIHAVAGASTSPTVTPGPAPIAPLIKSTDIENKSITQ